MEDLRVGEKQEDVLRPGGHPLFELNRDAASMSRHLMELSSRAIRSGLKQLIHDRFNCSHVFQNLPCSVWVLFFSDHTPLVQCGAASSYQYFRIGEKADSTAIPGAGTALMGGGKDLDEAFRWLCKKGNGGDFLVLRARGDNDYNSYVNGMCKLNSVATLVIPDTLLPTIPPSRTLSATPKLFHRRWQPGPLRQFWQGTPVQDAINANIAGGKPIGGTSAGLAVLGEFAMAV